ncbi:hypothetical protein PISL3812_06466 [Talaromyces islandicus]|uniref:F-box domain-containing protein n=1 Tax=Talaromyces islandicus TaxID=28573 RepID=A0A0U1M331_TALIS|nr:hypothetical protein PISL3812_06466 [Talaromyces islandicus]
MQNLRHVGANGICQFGNRVNPLFALLLRTSLLLCLDIKPDALKGFLATLVSAVIMVRKKTISNKRAKRDHDRKPFHFMKLPPELRLEIYHFAVVQKGDSTYTLQPPALAQVCRQIRAEILPVYYGENDFYIPLNIDVISYEDDMYPIREDDATQLAAFLKRCGAIVSTGGLKYVKNLGFHYSEPVFEDSYNYLLSFEFSSGNGDENKNTQSDDRAGNDNPAWNKYEAVLKEYNNNKNQRDDRIGDDNIDWGDYEAVRKAFNVTLDREVGIESHDLRDHVPVDGVIDVLFKVAQHCHAANRDVRLSWDYGH